MFLNIILVIVKGLIPMALGALVGAATARHVRKKASDSALQSLLRVQLKAVYRASRQKGSISMEELSDVDSLYSSYHKMGFNGVGTEIYQKIKNLPIIG